MQERGARRMGQGLPHTRLDPDPVDLAHREDLRLQRPQELTLALVERADPHEREPPRLDRRKRPAGTREVAATQAERRGEHHAVDIPARRRLRRVQIAVRVEPEHSAGPVRARHPDERAERDGVVAAEHERERGTPGGFLDERRDVVAQLEDLRQEP